MKKIIGATLFVGAVVLAPVAQAGPAMCGGHVEYGDAAFGMNEGDMYITACGGDSGPDAGGNNATAPKVSTKVTG